jgi:hypothetical protein
MEMNPQKLYYECMILSFERLFPADFPAEAAVSEVSRRM